MIAQENGNDLKKEQLAKLVMEMHQSYDNGLREYQEAIYFCIYQLLNLKEGIHSKKEISQNADYLMDLAGKLKKLEEIVTSPVNILIVILHCYCL